MNNFIGQLGAAIAQSPALALLGVGVLVLIPLVPIALRIAGLSGKQIVDLLTTTARFALNLAVALRCTDDKAKVDETKSE